MLRVCRMWLQVEENIIMRMVKSAERTTPERKEGRDHARASTVPGQVSAHHAGGRQNVTRSRLRLRGLTRLGEHCAGVLMLLLMLLLLLLLSFTRGMLSISPCC